MSDQDRLRPSQPEGTATCTGSGESTYLVFTQVGTHWHGRSSLNNLFVFGDSYSSRLSGAFETDEDDPYDPDDDDATWVDFLASSISSRSTAIVVNNFAFPGATVEYDLDGQLARFFDGFSKKTEPGEATFVFFLGINDCGGIPGEEVSSLVDVLFDAIHKLYINATARNFILVDVPPTDRSPAAAGTTTDLASRIEEWNSELVAQATNFVSNSTETTIWVFSSSKVLSEVLDNPSAQGFAESARDVVGRGIWRDSLHLTPAVHEIIASRMLSTLGL
ncbi:hypothetical protein EV363DRAFT_1307923 [Boletus edulis]|uniref:Carbohydrate esterase family 16 protein n=1 Tax=Boletus edulis BED1 TaxID=1328754 RepID=A0AAD4GKZ0_BOLED|nr:hypothetical protein EV363DRAFT_1307923 [Boletus edulis]KAF8448770.1 hypothetical protein L210DRAFT_3523087 [Boletus edulis BED1]